MNLRACLPAVALLGIILPASPLPGEEPGKKAETREVEVKDITLKAPATWKQTEPSGPAARLRLAQFEIPAAKGDEGTVELVVSSFGGGGGGLQANLPRWVGEFDAEGRKMKVSTGKSTQGEYSVADISGTHLGPGFNRRQKPLENARMIAIMLSVPEKGIYFLKVSGPEKTIAAAADELRAAIGANAKDEKPYQPEAE